MSAVDERGPFARLVRRYRTAAGLSQDELAERAMLSRRGIADIERGARRSPHAITIRRLVEALHLTPAERDALIVSAHHAAAARAGRNAATPLPVPPSTFVGREREMADILRLLGSRRLLTITGAGGSGKTRLALEIARAIADTYQDGAAMVLLAPLSSVELVAPTIGQVLGVRQPVGRSAQDALAAHLRTRHLLLLLDNFEHLLDASPLIADLLAACAGLTVLATSREPLHLREEQEYPVPPLELPQPGRDLPARVLLECASVELFTQRARQFDPSFTVGLENARVVADICLRLEGLPLAIELAAARTKVLSPSLLLERLDTRLTLLVGGARDLPARQRTLRDTIAWSHDLLGAADRRVFRRLAVCAGCTLSGAEAVCGIDSESEPTTVLNELHSLVDKNLLRYEAAPGDEPRFTMLETIRDFAVEQLHAHGELDDARFRHTRHYLDWLAIGGSRELADHRHGWMHRLDLEYDNLRAAVRWALDQRQISLVLSAAPALTRYGHMRGHLRELRQWWQEALDLSDEADPTAWPKAAIVLALVLFVQRERQPVRPLLEESLTRFRALGHKQGTAHALLQLGSAAQADGDPSTGVPLLREAERLFRELAQDEDVAWSVWNAGIIQELQGDYGAAERAYTRALTIVRGVRQPASISQAIALEGLEVTMLISLGAVRLRLNDVDASDAYLSEATELAVRLASPELSVTCALHMAGVALRRGATVRAARLLGGAEGLAGAIDSGLLPVYRDVYETICSELEYAPATGGVAAARWEGRRLSMRELSAFALERTASSPERIRVVR